jgi:hypothetical protein
MSATVVMRMTAIRTHVDFRIHHGLDKVSALIRESANHVGPPVEERPRRRSFVRGRCVALIAVPSKLECLLDVRVGRLLCYG